MREKKRGKRLLALLLACTLLVTSIPVQAAPVNAPEMAGREEGAEGLEVPAGTEDPAGNTEGAEVPAEPELILRKPGGNGSSDGRGSSPGRDPGYLDPLL